MLCKLIKRQTGDGSCEDEMSLPFPRENIDVKERPEKIDKEKRRCFLLSATFGLPSSAKLSRIDRPVALEAVRDVWGSRRGGAGAAVGPQDKT